MLHLLLGLASKGFKVLKLVCWGRKAFKCSEYFEVREEFVLDVTPETTLSGAGGGYSAEQGENQPLTVMCCSKRLSSPQGGRSIPVPFCGYRMLGWWPIHMEVALVWSISPPPLPTRPTHLFLKRPRGVSQKERPSICMTKVRCQPPAPALSGAVCFLKVE